MNLVGENLSYKLTEELQLRKISFNFEKGKLYVEKGSERQAAKVLKQSKDINKVPKIIGETTEFTEYADLEELKQKYEILATTEAVDV